MKYSKNNMKNIFIAIISVPVFILSLLGCADDRSGNEPVLARINDYELSLNEFDRQLFSEIEMEPEFKLTVKAKKAFLEQLIRKELMIQEAMRLKMDREEKFIKAIERYWQSTLIRDLLLLRGEDINQTTYISQAEIEARYLQMKKEEETDLDLKKVKDQIIVELKEEKKTKKLQNWVNDLRKNATIEIDQELLQKGK